VLSALAVRFAGVAPTLDSGLGATGPVVVGASLAVLTLVPTVALAVRARRR
jgi:hypothetical protein